MDNVLENNTSGWYYNKQVKPYYCAASVSIGTHCRNNYTFVAYSAYWSPLFTILDIEHILIVEKPIF